MMRSGGRAFTAVAALAGTALLAWGLSATVGAIPWQVIAFGASRPFCEGWMSRWMPKRGRCSSAREWIPPW